MEKLLRKTFKALGTVNTIVVPDSCSTALQEAEQRVLELDNRFSVFKENSEISCINRAAGLDFVKVHADTFEVIKAALHFSQLSQGAFDISARPLVGLWGIGKKGTRIPSPEEIAAEKQLVDFRDIVLDEKSQSVMLRRPLQALDLGGIAKGYAADEVRRILVEHGCTDALINLGGTVITMGAPRTIGIQDPRKEAGIPMGKLQIANCALVTSGSYEKYFIRDGVRYHHIIDPRTGFPARSELLGVTLIGNSAMELDALSTAVFILGIQKGVQLLEKSSIEAVFIQESFDVFTTPALRDKFTLI